MLVLNGREQGKVDLAREWLDAMSVRADLENVAVVLLGNELCNNSWLHRYTAPTGRPVKVVFLVYDSPEVDNRYVFQWPLGVATYVPLRFSLHKKRLASQQRLANLKKIISRVITSYIIMTD